MTEQINPQTGEIVQTAKGRRRVGCQNYQCPICKNKEACNSIYTEELWNDDGSCPKFTYDESTSQSKYPAHVI